jgi:hypothetical protein
LNWDDLSQRPALPLGSWLKTDPWDDRVHQLNAKIYAYMNPRDKMPLELTPVFYKLQRYDASRLAPVVSPAATPAPAPPPATDEPAAPPAAPDAAPASTSTTSPPAQGTSGEEPQPASGTSNPPEQ